jgi:hypothetical protein
MTLVELSICTSHRQASSHIRYFIACHQPSSGRRRFIPRAKVNDHSHAKQVPDVAAEIEQTAKNEDHPVIGRVTYT